MSFPVSISFPPPLLPSPSVRFQYPKRPRGLWRAHVTAARVSAAHVLDRKRSSISDTDDDETAGRPPQKKLRTRSGSTSDSDPSPLFADYTSCSFPPRPLPSHHMVSSSIARPSASIDPPRSYDFDDWNDLKHLFTRAAEQYEGNAPESLPQLRAVIHECHHFLQVNPDPSSLFIIPPSTPSTPPPGDHKKRLDSSSTTSTSTASTSTLKVEQRQDRKSILLDLPTAFHALLGTSLFLFGNLIAQDPSLALEGEPTHPVPYWLVALDVFEMGENLPVRTRGVGNNVYPEDWRMAIMWGRTLVCLADDLVNRQDQAKREGHDPSTIQLDVGEPRWQQGSPFHTMAALRQPVTRRMSLNSATPNELLVLAMDQFSRGILHMPHDQSPQVRAMMLAATFSPPHVSAVGERWDGSSRDPTTTSIGGSSPERDMSPRQRELYTIASEVLLIAEKLDVSSERHYWAGWADSVLKQMKVENADGSAWRSRVLRKRGRCRLVVGSAYVEDIEAALERGEMDVLDSEEAQEARDDLTMAADFFERAKVGPDDDTAAAGSDSNEHELRLLLAEALVTLANLTGNVDKREELYKRAKNEAGPGMDLDLDDDEDEDEDEYRMDESH